MRFFKEIPNFPVGAGEKAGVKREGNGKGLLKKLQILQKPLFFDRKTM